MENNMGMNNGRSNPAGQGGRIKKVWTNLRINFLKDDQTLKNWITGWRPKQFNFDTKKQKYLDINLFFG